AHEGAVAARDALERAGHALAGRDELDELLVVGLRLPDGFGLQLLHFTPYRMEHWAAVLPLVVHLSSASCPPSRSATSQSSTSTRPPRSWPSGTAGTGSRSRSFRLDSRIWTLRAARSRRSARRRALPAS